MKTALFTGSFDPMTKGHLDLIQRSSEIFGKVIVAVGNNPAKKYTFSKEKRVELINNNAWNLKNVSVVELQEGKLAADYAYEHDAVIVKGVRVNADFDYEKMMHEINHLHNQGVDTIIFPSQSDLNHISSSSAKEVCKLSGNTEDFVTLDVKYALERELLGQNRIIITGTIGSGKSSVVEEIVKNWQSVKNIDIDVIAHDILFKRKEPAYVNLRKKLVGELAVPGPWTRENLSYSIFSKPEKRTILNSLIRQPILTRIRAEIQEFHYGLIIFNSALIVEAGWLDLANNRVALLDVESETQHARLLHRGYSEEEIAKRLASQLNTKEKESIIRSKIVKDNFGCVQIFNTTSQPVKETAKDILKWVGEIN